MKILQIASHKTNIGDGANILGFQRTLREDFSELGETHITFIDEEIMEYKPHIGDKDFNSNAFVDLANSVDLVVIGGGGFFSAFARFRNTGCHADFTLETLDRIKTPIVYYALGFAVYYGQAYHNIDKLKGLFEYAKANKSRIKISLRNDGSRERLTQFFDDELLSEVCEIPDGGFFIDPKKQRHEEIAKGRVNLGVQLAGDKVKFRFQEHNSIIIRGIEKVMSLIGFDILFAYKKRKFLEDLAQVITNLHNRYDINLVLLPHIYSDLSILEKLMHKLPMDLVRFNTHVSSVHKAPSGAHKQFDLYKNLDLVIGARFHSNVCSFAVETPSIGVVTHDQLDCMYQSLGVDRFIMASDPDFSKKLFNLATQSLQRHEDIKKNIRNVMKGVRQQTKEYHTSLYAWLKQ